MGALFTAQGRLARLPYFGYGVLVYLLLLATVLAGAGISAAAGSDAGGIPGGLVIFAGVIAAIYAGTTILIRRLHDLGLSGRHAIWIMMLNVVSQVLLTAAPPLGLLLSIGAIGVTLWLLFAPGEKAANRWGPPKGAAEVPPTAESAAS